MVDVRLTLWAEDIDNKNKFVWIDRCSGRLSSRLGRTALSATVFSLSHGGFEGNQDALIVSVRGTRPCRGLVRTVYGCRF